MKDTGSHFLRTKKTWKAYHDSLINKEANLGSKNLVASTQLFSSSNFKWISGTEFKELNEFCTEWDKPEKWTELENKILDENSKILGVKSLPAMNLANPAMKVKQSKKRKRSEKIKSESPKAKMSKLNEIPKYQKKYSNICSIESNSLRTTRCQSGGQKDSDL